ERREKYIIRDKISQGRTYEYLNLNSHGFIIAAIIISIVTPLVPPPTLHSYSMHSDHKSSRSRATF
ncbi:hypothetical protein M404DRAFT_1006765, partial [Pisolithus tinctorius Marx 270]